MALALSCEGQYAVYHASKAAEAQTAPVAQLAGLSTERTSRARALEPEGVPQPLLALLRRLAELRQVVDGQLLAGDDQPKRGVVS